MHGGMWCTTSRRLPSGAEWRNALAFGGASQRRLSCLLLLQLCTDAVAEEVTFYPASGRATQLIYVKHWRSHLELIRQPRTINVAFSHGERLDITFLYSCDLVVEAPFQQAMESWPDSMAMNPTRKQRVPPFEPSLCIQGYVSSMDSHTLVKHMFYWVIIQGLTDRGPFNLSWPGRLQRQRSLQRDQCHGDATRPTTRAQRKSGDSRPKTQSLRSWPFWVLGLDEFNQQH